MEDEEYIKSILIGILSLIMLAFGMFIGYQIKDTSTDNMFKHHCETLKSEYTSLRNHHTCKVEDKIIWKIEK